MSDNSDEAPPTPLTDCPVDWEALENAFENNAPEVHSYLQLVTGDVLRVVDGVADPQMHARIASDSRYVRIEPVSSREQYRWMERYIPLVEEPKLRARLEVSIDGKGAFRRFKDVLMAYGPERERWFTYRSERLKTFMEAWLGAHSIQAVARVEWSAGIAQTETATSAGVDDPAGGAPGSTPVPESFDVRRGRNIEASRMRLREFADSLAPRDLETVVSFAEFLRARRTARAFAHHHGSHYARREDAAGALAGEESKADETSSSELPAASRPDETHET
jgi:hypothetical protein